MNLFWTPVRGAARAFFPPINLIGLLCLFPFLMAACASSPDPTPASVPDFVPVADGAPSPTPFQPIGSVNVPTESSFVPPRLPVESVPNFTPQAVTAPAPTAALPEIPSLNLIVDINPLTGLPPADPILLERRPLVIKISNYPREIRPQYGLTLADQVFEYYIEWGDTRFIGVFYGNDSKQVGPVRSGRFFDEHLARMYNAFLVFNYADPREWNYLKGSDLYPYLVIPSCTGGICPPFFVSNSSNLPDEEHFTNYFDTTRFNDFAKEKNVNNSRQPIRNGFFSESIPESQMKVNRMYTYFSVRDYSYWEYAPTTRTYLRFQETMTLDPDGGVTEKVYAPLVDAATSQQVNAQNVVFLYVSHTFANKFNAEDEVYHINLVDAGLAYVFRDGVVIPARWTRPEMDQPLFLTTLEGDPIFLRPGRTFYQVIGMTSILQQDADEWYFEFQTP
ncbi:MAG TPA: DUF3048 domain-containing protein [Anaerolineales bacterium]|nr:DUF3048 domain-containing protein [Anaerolineales bacterium]